MRNYQVGILTGVSYIALIVACACFREESLYETHDILKPVVIFEYLPSYKKEDDTFDEFKFVSGTVAGMEKIKAISRRNEIMVDETKTKTTPMLKPEITSKYSKNDTILLKAIAQLEAGNQGLDGIRRVVDVILNRVDSSKFPNSIYDVLYSPFFEVRNGILWGICNFAFVCSWHLSDMYKKHTGRIIFTICV